MSFNSFKEAATAKLNSGLVRLASVRNYPPSQKAKFAVGARKFRRGGVFRVGVLHRKPFSEEVLKRNRRGYINAQVNTVAHAPSLYHWLFHRCGIPFEETQMLIATGGLRMNGTVVQRLEEAEVQRPWLDWQQMVVEVRTTNPLAVQALQKSFPSSSSRPPYHKQVEIFPCSEERGRTERNSGNHMEENDDNELENEEENVPRESSLDKEGGNREKGGRHCGGMAQVGEEEESVFVLALHRALHRRYLFQYLHPSISISSEVSEPRSFVHRLTPFFFFTSSEALGLNHLRPIGVMTGFRGLGIVTNDASMIRYWNNSCLGNFGVYDVRFVQGTPREVMEGARTRLLNALQTSVIAQLPAALLRDSQRGCSLSIDTLRGSTAGLVGTIPPCECSLEPVPPSSRDWVSAQFSSSSLLSSQQGNGRRSPREYSRDSRLLVTTPLFPYREVKQLWRLGAVITLIRSGPFSLPEDLARTRHRSLTVEELALLFAFERKLKINRMILSLREFDADEYNEERQGP